MANKLHHNGLTTPRVQSSVSNEPQCTLHDRPSTSVK